MGIPDVAGMKGSIPIGLIFRPQPSLEWAGFEAVVAYLSTVFLWCGWLRAG